MIAVLLLIIAFLIFSFVAREIELLKSTAATVYISVAILCFAGFAFGYGASLLARLSPRMSRAVALETGIQNTPLTMAVILTSFPDAHHAEMMILPLIYAISIVIYSCIVTSIFRKFSSEAA